MACSLTKFVWNFAVYCGKEEKSEDVAHIAREEACLVHRVVLDLAADVQGNGHIITLNNFFISMGLLDELALRQIYAT